MTTGKFFDGSMRGLIQTGQLPGYTDEQGVVHIGAYKTVTLDAARILAGIQAGLMTLHLDGYEKPDGITVITQISVKPDYSSPLWVNQPDGKE